MISKRFIEISAITIEKKSLTKSKSMAETGIKTAKCFRPEM